MAALKDGEVLATFRSDRELWEGFKALCDKNDISAAKALNRFLKASVEAGEFPESIISDSPASDINIEELEARLLSQMMSAFEQKFEELREKKKPAIARKGRS